MKKATEAEAGCDMISEFIFDPSYDFLFELKHS